MREELLGSHRSDGPIRTGLRPAVLRSAVSLLEPRRMSPGCSRRGRRDDGGTAPARATRSRESQDAVHDAVVVAWQKWDTLRDRARFEPWFNRIVVNVCRNRLKQSSRRRTADIAAQTSLNNPDASADVHRRILVEQAFAGLKPDDVVVLALRHLVDLEIEDIARLLDVPLPTAKTRLRSARTRLRGLIDEQTSEEASL